MIKILVGDFFESSAATLVNAVNCVGVMGKGIALVFKERYPDMFKEYRLLCQKNMLKCGVPYYYSDSDGNSILFFPTKKHWRSPSELSYIAEGLDWFVDNYKKLKITSIAFPALGCGNGGLSWNVVGALMYSKLKNLPIDIEIYAPFGTNPNETTIEFLEKTIKIKDSEAGN